MQTLFTRQAGVGLLVVLLLGLGAVPAHAGSKPKKVKTVEEAETVDPWDTYFPTTETSETSETDGDINPTSVPVVDDDFTEALSVVRVAEPVLVEPLVAVKLTGRDKQAALAVVEPVVEATRVEEIAPVEVINLADYIDSAVEAALDTAAAHGRATGKGVLVAVLDAGFTLDHPFFEGRVSPEGYDFIDYDDDPNDYGNGIDDDKDGWTDRGVGHGTGVAAMVLTAAPDAMILPLRVRDDEGHGTDSPVVEAIEYAIAHGAKVINLSLDADTTDKEVLLFAIMEARFAGVVVVTSAGNDGLPYLPLQSASSAHLTVGAVDATDTLAPFSNYSLSEWDAGRLIFAPGVDLVCPMVIDGVFTRGTWSGTSFSAGLVSGGVALALEMYPGDGADTIAKRVVTAVSPILMPDGTKHPFAGRISLTRVVSQ